MDHTCFKCEQPTDMWIDDEGVAQWICADCLTGKERKRSKFNNNIIHVDGYTFQSELEAARWAQLKLLEQGGHIYNVRPHIPYVIVEAALVNGERERSWSHVVDFDYYEHGGQHVVEDTKSTPTKTELWKLKRRLFVQRYPYIQYRVVTREDMSK